MSHPSNLAVPMSIKQQSPLREAADWTLPAGAARRLAVGPGPRWLQVTTGRVWLTTTNGGASMEQDRWLSDGDAVYLPTGTEVVLEAWGGEARFDLFVPPQACAQADGGPLRSRIEALWRRTVGAARRTGVPTGSYLAV